MGGSIMIYAYPLNWPVGWPRTDSFNLEYGSFKVDYDKAIRELDFELERLDAESAVLTTDMPLRVGGTPRRDTRPESTAVALYFTRHGAEVCIPCDKFVSVLANVRAIGITLQNIRQMERYGTTQMIDAVFRGFTGIPASASGGEPVIPPQPWYDILHVSPDSPPEVIEGAYKALRRKYHPDMPGGDEAAFNRIQNAYEESTK